MQNIRPLLFIAWLITGFLIWQAWTEFNRPDAPTFSGDVPAADLAPAADRPQAPADVPDASAVPAPPSAVTGAAGADPVAAPSSGQLISVSTDVLRLQIDTQGGTIVSAHLLDYPVCAGAD